MEFNIKKPGNIVALVVILISFYVLFFDPILSYLNVFSLTEYLGFTNVSLVVLFTTILLTCTPFIWYFFVDRYSPKEMFYALKLRSEGIDRAFLFGVIAAILMFVITTVIAVVLFFVVDMDQEALAGVTKIAGGLSILSLILIVFQAISAEIYLRGFLLEKIDSFAGKNMAIVVTAVLYGLIHLSYGELYPAILPIFLGIILGYVVMKTKNLYSAITAQIFFNIVVIVLNLVSLSIG